MNKFIYIFIMGSIFLNIGSLYSCKTISSQIISINKDKIIQYGTKEFHDWENTKNYKLDDAYEIFKSHISDNPNIKLSDHFKKGILGFIYDDNYIFSTTDNSFKSGTFNLTGFWVDSNTGKIEFKETNSSIEYREWHDLYIGISKSKKP